MAGRRVDSMRRVMALLSGWATLLHCTRPASLHSRPRLVKQGSGALLCRLMAPPCCYGFDGLEQVTPSLLFLLAAIRHPSPRGIPPRHALAQLSGGGG